MEESNIAPVLWVIIILSTIGIFWYHGRKKN